MTTTAIRLTVTGRVQGVGFRAWTCREARSYGLRGWVRNRGDGSVEMLLIGHEEAIDAMVGDCREGPELAEVEEVTFTAATDDGSPDFTERPTV